MEKIPDLTFESSDRPMIGQDPVAHADRYHNILTRRFLAWLVDSAMIALLAVAAFALLLVTNIVTLGLMMLPVTLGFALVPLLYYTIAQGGTSAGTPGMRLLGIVLRCQDGRHPGYGRALLRTLLYFASVSLLSPLVLLIMLCNGRRRAAHDVLSGTVVVNRQD